MTSHITAKITPWLDAAIKKHGQGETILWETAISPNEQGQPMFMLLIWFPSGMLGVTFNAPIPVPNPFDLSEEQVDTMITDVLEGLRNARSQSLAQQMNGHGQQQPGQVNLPDGFGPPIQP